MFIELGHCRGERNSSVIDVPPGFGQRGSYSVRRFPFLSALGIGLYRDTSRFLPQDEGDLLHLRDSGERLNCSSRIRKTLRLYEKPFSGVIAVFVLENLHSLPNLLLEV